MTCRLQLYQFAERLNKLQIDLKPLKKTNQGVSGCLCGAGTPARFFPRAQLLTFAGLVQGQNSIL